MKYSIIFDTNVLFVNYDKGGDFLIQHLIIS